MFDKKLAMGLALAGLLGSLLAGCATPTAAAPAAQIATDRPVTGITVVGEGQAFAVPDIARLTLGVDSTGTTAKAAMDENSRKMNAVVQAIKDLGIADRDIQTTGINVFPVYEQRRPEVAPDTGPQIVGYRASNAVRITVADPQRAAEILDAVMSAGATNVSNLEFDVEDQAQLQRQALAEAGKSAQDKAKVIADSLGIRLGSIVAVQEDFSGGPQPMPAVRAAAQSADSVPVQAGELSVTATMHVTYSIQ